MKKTFTKFAFALLIGLNSSCMQDPSLTLSIPKEGFTVVQHIPANQKGRTQNALYLPPRPIKQKELNTPGLQTLVDSMYAVMLQKSGVGIAVNQLGKRLQVFIIEAKADNPRYQVLGAVEKQVFINSIITKVSEQRKNF